MAESIGGYGGGILGLYGLLEEHREAIDYDCLTLGLDIHDLGTDDFPWTRLKAVLTYLPSTSALARSQHGELAVWGATEHLLAAAVDALNAANWQRAGGKGRKPKPVPRPGEDQAKGQRRFGTGKLGLDEARKFFERVNRGLGQIRGTHDAI